MECGAANGTHVVQEAGGGGWEWSTSSRLVGVAHDTQLFLWRRLLSDVQGKARQSRADLELAPGVPSPLCPQRPPCKLPVAVLPPLPPPAAAPLLTGAHSGQVDPFTRPCPIAALPDSCTPRPALPPGAAAPVLRAAHSGQVDHFKAMSRAEQQEVERMYQSPCFKVRET